MPSASTVTAAATESISSAVSEGLCSSALISLITARPVLTVSALLPPLVVPSSLAVLLQAAKETARTDARPTARIFSFLS